MFSNKDLKNLIIPLFLEQLLLAFVGIADVFVIGFVGEAAVSGVSLVNSFNTIFLNLFTALAAGGAVVISQYIGRKDREHAAQSATQLLTASILLSVVIAVVVLLTNASLMRLVFGKVEDDVMAACVTYLRISVYSYPALAIYNAVPNGVESGISQLVKVALSSVVALFGTYQIAANGVAQSIWSMAALVCVTMGPVFITVIGQCMGARDIVQAEYYFKKLLKITVIFAVPPVMMSFYALAPETKHLTILLVLIHNIFSATAFPSADPLGKGLRATGDVKFTTAVSLFTTIVVRLVFSIIFGIGLHMGVIGIALAMCLDWSSRGVIFWWRFKQGKWKSLKVI